MNNKPHIYWAILYIILLIIVISISIFAVLIFKVNSYTITLGIILISITVLIWGLRMIILAPIVRVLEETKQAGLRLLSTDEQLRTLTENLKAKNEEIMKLNSELERKATELEAFSYSVFHDLKSPLISMKGFISLLEQKYSSRLKEDGKQYLNNVLASITHMSELVYDLLELSKIGQVKMKLEDVDVEELIEGLKRRFEPLFNEKSIKFVIHTPLPHVYGDIQRINQLFENLISNAIKFSSKDEEPKIEVGENKINDKFTEYFVKDNGIGIAKEDHEKVFQPFFRLSEVDVEGTGIGLAIVKKVVEHHGGKIWVKSKKKEGTTFYFTLPLTPFD